LFVFYIIGYIHRRRGCHTGWARGADCEWRNTSQNVPSYKMADNRNEMEGQSAAIFEL